MGDGNSNGIPGNGIPSGTGWAMAAARRRAMRQTMRPPTIKHGLVHAPTIKHPRDDTGPSFGVGGGFKASGF